MLGILTIIDPCTLFTSIAAIGYIDKEVSNKRRVLVSGSMFVLGKMVCYCLLSIPFLLGAQTSSIQHLIEHYGEPVMAIFILLCGVFMLVSGHLHHHHDHGFFTNLEKRDSRYSWFWAFLMGLFFAVAFCPHRLIYFLTMIDIALTEAYSYSWVVPIIFSLGTGLPVMLVAVILAYSASGIGKLTNSVGRFEKWFRYTCGVLFIIAGLYLVAHSFSHHHHEETPPTTSVISTITSQL